MTPPLHPSDAALRRRTILSALESLDDPQQRLQWVVERARSKPPLPDAFRTDACRVAGCQVRTWWNASCHAHRWTLHADSDAVTLKALLGLLAESYDGESSQGILDEPPDFLERLGLLRQLAESRRATVLRVAQALSAAALADIQNPTIPA